VISDGSHSQEISAFRRKIFFFGGWLKTGKNVLLDFQRVSYLLPFS
jgi:hypothetical protein